MTCDLVLWNRQRGYSNDYIETIQMIVGTDVDGIWGPKTVDALFTWQRVNGLQADGKHGPLTRTAMVAAEALLGGNPEFLEALYPMPEYGSVNPMSGTDWGYDHMPWTYRQLDPHWTQCLSTDTVTAAMVRLVSGWRLGSRGATYSRGPDSCISLDTLSIGFPSWWMKRIPELLSMMAKRCPDICTRAWGKNAAEHMRDEDWIVRLYPPVTGKMKHDPDLDWFVAGWYEYSRHPEMLVVQVDAWLEEFGRPAVEMMDRYGWVEKRTAVMLSRMHNTGSGKTRRCISRAIEVVGGDVRKNELAIIEAAAVRSDCYDEPDRWERVLSMDGLDDELEAEPLASDLTYSYDVIRVNNSRPSWSD